MTQDVLTKFRIWNEITWFHRPTSPLSLCLGFNYHLIHPIGTWFFHLHYGMVNTLVHRALEFYHLSWVSHLVVPRDERAPVNEPVFPGSEHGSFVSGEFELLSGTWWQELTISPGHSHTHLMLPWCFQPFHSLVRIKKYLLLFSCVTINTSGPALLLELSFLLQSHFQV